MRLHSQAGTRCLKQDGVGLLKALLRRYHNGVEQACQMHALQQGPEARVKVAHKAQLDPCR